MDIKLPLDANLQAGLAKTSANPLNLKLNQLISAKVISNQIALDTLTLKVADQQVLVQTPRALNLQNGQTLQLQVTKLTPAAEFQIVEQQPASRQPETKTAQAPVLKLLNLLPATMANPTHKPVLDQLTAGQKLQATIVGNDGKQLTLQLSAPQTNQTADTGKPPLANTGNSLVTIAAKQFILPADGQPAPANASKPALPTLLTPGNLIDLEVLKAGPTPTFAAMPATIDTEQKIVALFKQLLPIQAPPPLLLNHLVKILPALENDSSIADTLKRLAREILNSIPQASQLRETEQLKQSIDRSGLFLESKLAQQLSANDADLPNDDLKLKLSKFVQLLKQEIDKPETQKAAADKLELLKETLQKTHGSLAKLTLDQFQSLPKDDAPKQGWLLELPFFNDRQADSVKIEIEKEQAGEQENKVATWAVTITITPPELATIHCRISCYDGSINTRFWSGSSATVEKITAHLDYLKQQFEQKGLKTGFMEAHQGQPAVDSVKKPLANLVSERV